MAGISFNGAYNHFVQDYVSKDVTQADAHRKDELRDVYKSIARINKKSPLYLLTDDDASRNDAIDIKERARELQSSIFKLSDQEDKSSLNHSAAYTSDDDKLTVSYIGKSPETDVGKAGFDIEVTQLATAQVNTGRFLPKDSSSILDAGNYALDVRIDDQEFEFQFSIYETDRNVDVLQKLDKLVNKANIGLSSEVLEDGGRAALQISASRTGLRSGNSSQFEVYESASPLAKGSVDALGLDKVSVPASNAHFTLNGEVKTSTSNHFTVGNKFDIQLKSLTTPGSPVRVGVKKDNEALINHVNSLVDSYNSFIDDTSRIKDEKFKGSKLRSEALGIAKQFMAGIEDIGISLGGDGKLSVDKELLSQVVSSSSSSESLAPVKKFADALLSKAKEIALDPMKYVDRPVVNYKNPDSRDNTTNPYITSEYSGMMFNNYC